MPETLAIAPSGGPSGIGGPVAKASLAELVYDRLLEGILSGSLPSGAPLNVADIAADLRVSPSPVRDALVRLETEGLAVSRANRRSTVVTFTRREVAELFEVREFLECGAAASAAERVDAAGVARLKSAIEACAALATDPARKREMLERDAEFHAAVAEVSGNRLLRDEVVRCNRRVRVMQVLNMAPARMRVAYPEHLKILAGIKRHDPAAASAAMRFHIREARDFVLEGFAATPPPSA
jgi:DNA-binding GntR family transcriptional regulator